MIVEDRPATIHVRPEEGTILKAFGDTLHVKLGKEHTNGSLVVAQGTVPPGGGPPPHRHHNEEEVFLVLEGRFGFLANGEWIEVDPGSVVYTPRGVVHTFKNIGDTTGKVWVVVTPCGFETFFEKCAAACAQATDGPPDIQRIVSISEEHGIEYVPPLVSPLSPPSEMALLGVL